MLRFEADWFKECYPFPDESGKKIFNSKEEAEKFLWKKYKAGYDTMLITRSDEED